MATNVTRPHYASASLYVGDLHPDVTEAVLYEFFNSVGPVASIRVCREVASSKSLGYAYVNYHSVGDAERALDTLNFTNIKGVPCRLMWCYRDPTLRRSGNGNLFVKNLDKAMDNKALFDAFSLFGNILSCKVATDDHGRSRGFGFVHFENEESAQMAIERVNGVKIGEKNVFVGHFKKRHDRESAKDSRFTNIYIKDFCDNWTEDNLQRIFNQFGTVTSLVIQRDKSGRRFAFCNYENTEAARAAVDTLHGRRVNASGRMLTPDEDREFEAQLDSAMKKGDETKKASDTSEKSTEETESSTRTESKVTDIGEETAWRLYVQRAQSKSERHQLLKKEFEQQFEKTNNKAKYEGVNLYVKNVAEEVTDAELRSLFEPFGTIVSAKIMKDANGNSKGFGFVSFSTSEEATSAVTELHQKPFHNKPLYVGLAERRESRLARLQHRFRSQFSGASVIGPGRSLMNSGMMMVSAPGPQMYYQGNMAVQNMMQQGAPATSSMWAAQQAAAAQQVAAAQQPFNLWKQGPPGQAGMMGMPPPPYQQQMMGGQRGRTQIMMQQPQAQPVPQAGGRRGMPMGPPSYKSVATHGLKAEGVMVPPPDRLNAQSLAMMQPEIQKQMLGERLFPQIARHQPALAGKITGMMLEMDNSELLGLLDSEEQLKAKIVEALHVLEQAKAIAPENRQP